MVNKNWKQNRTDEEDEMESGTFMKERRSACSDDEWEDTKMSVQN